MNAEFDFEAAGYEGPADWARLHDLIPADITQAQRASLEVSDTKTAVCALLKIHGVDFERRYDAEAAAARNKP